MLKIFLDPISQPCRAVMILLDINNIPFEPQLVQILKGEQHTNQNLRAANPNCQLPALVEGDFSLHESPAIMKYICNTREVGDNGYTKDATKRRARLDQYLDWHSGELRTAVIYRRTNTPGK